MPPLLFAGEDLLRAGAFCISLVLHWLGQSGVLFVRFCWVLFVLFLFVVFCFVCALALLDY